MPKTVTLSDITFGITTHLGVDASQVHLHSNLTTDLGADSLDLVELAMLFEDDYDIELDDDKLSTVTTVQGLLDLINSSIAQPR